MDMQGISWRELLNILLEDTSILDEPILVIGRKDGFDLIQAVVVLDEPIQTKDGPIFGGGKIAIKLKSENLDSKN